MKYWEHGPAVCAPHRSVTCGRAGNSLDDVPLWAKWRPKSVVGNIGKLGVSFGWDGWDLINCLRTEIVQCRQWPQCYRHEQFSQSKQPTKSFTSPMPGPIAADDLR